MDQREPTKGQNTQSTFKLKLELLFLSQERKLKLFIWLLYQWTDNRSSGQEGFEMYLSYAITYLLTRFLLQLGGAQASNKRSPPSFFLSQSLCSLVGQVQLPNLLVELSSPGHLWSTPWSFDPGGSTAKIVLLCLHLVDVPKPPELPHLDFLAYFPLFCLPPQFFI